MPEPTAFSVTVGRHRGTAVLVLAGELDLLTAPQAAAQLRSLEQDPGDEVIIDLRRLTFMDSSGVAFLLRAVRTAEDRDWRLCIVEGPPEVRRVLEICGLVDTLPLAKAPVAAG